MSKQHEYVDYASANAVYEAPEYLGCYDICHALMVMVTLENSNNLMLTVWPENIGVGTDKKYYGRPQNDSYVNKENDYSGNETQKGCGSFARLCTANDVGCSAYMPTDGGDTVFGNVSYNDFCPSECAGYSAFSKTETFFELSEFPLYFIPTTAKSCSSSEVGCESFTNLDELAKGGEAVEYSRS